MSVLCRGGDAVTLRACSVPMSPCATLELRASVLHLISGELIPISLALSNRYQRSEIGFVQKSLANLRIRCHLPPRLLMLMEPSVYRNPFWLASILALFPSTDPLIQARFGEDKPSLGVFHKRHFLDSTDHGYPMQCRSFHMPLHGQVNLPESKTTYENV
jgi:hypothetical protein